MFEGRFFELLIIFVLALVVLGPEKLPRVVSEVGRWVGRARAMARQFREQLEEEVVLEETRRTQAAARPRPESPPSPAATSQPSTPEAHAAAGAPQGAVPTPDGQHPANAHPEAVPPPPPDTPWEAGSEPQAQATPSSSEPHTQATASGPESHANPGASDSATRQVNGTDHYEAYASPDEPRMTPSAQPLNGSSTTSPHERGT